MKTAFLFIAILLTFAYQVYGQTRTIQGLVIDEDLLSLPGFFIETADHHQIAKTDIEGRFRIDVPSDIKKLIFGWVGFESATITLNNDCDTVEMIMLPRATYDFMSSRKIDKERLAHFRKLPKLHLQAYQKGIFSKPSACYSINFEPIKSVLDSISKEYSFKGKQIKF